MSDEHNLVAFELARRGWTKTDIARELGHDITTVAKLFSRPASSYSIHVPTSDAWKMRIERACTSHAEIAA